MDEIRSAVYFPKQRVSYGEKQKAEWYANCIDFVIAKGQSINDRDDAERKLDILHGNMPNEFYKKTLNPYNSENEKYTRFPAVMRNLDIMNDIVRRYISEYYTGSHEFVAGANSPDLILAKNKKLAEEVMLKAQQAFQNEFEKAYKEATQSAIQNGQNPEDINPEELMPNIDEFVEDFNNKYIDEQSAQAQDVLDFIRSNTKDMLIYSSAFFNFVTLGECYSYSKIEDNIIEKENVPVIEAYPIPNGEFFIEDHDMFARRFKMSYQQIIDSFDEFLSDNDKAFLNTYYANRHSSSGQKLRYEDFFNFYPDVCGKFGEEERELFRKYPVVLSDLNSDLFDVWHVVWRGEAKVGILTYINEVGFQTTRIVEENYQFNPENGDIEIRWEYQPQVYEGYRIGTRNDSIYPIKARPVTYNRNGKLPYNGIMELLPLMGKFSIIELITPYQVMRNIFAFHREMAIAKNKQLILLLPESLINDDTEDKLYKMQADNVLLVDDTEDATAQKMAQVRLLNANIGQYINELTQLIESVKMEARELVDMNAQRYGDIAQTAGATITQEAITRSSMGMVIITQMFDEFRKVDYTRDLDFAKFAYIDGLDTSYYDITGKKRYISLDVNSYVNSDLSVNIKNNAKEFDKIKELKQWAFSAAQNGDLDMAMAAITGDNVTQIKQTIERFSEIKRKHEEDMQQAQQMLEQQKIQNELTKIQAQGEQDRLTEELKYQYELQLKNIDASLSLMATSDGDKEVQNSLNRMIQESKENIERLKLDLESRKLAVDAYNAAADRQVKMHDIDTKLKIAKTNKNKYDK